MLLGALASSTVSRQDGAVTEFLSWLSSHGRGRDWWNCTPDDVLVYMTVWWLPRHQGRSGGPVGPAAVKSLGMLGCASVYRFTIAPFPTVARSRDLTKEIFRYDNM
ncbi:hypothetical protein VOLCADRAFT_108796 [Volvox carteri f. nagariensis]|uniref:Uncharacterized protein n=1 Tax=Volvox carteri f. nagariensis TaxID=3068 RepID=D8UMN3_VOLCA|nr:uncharacterized protein VOLCADRAFT_108796 [Volvox carteri f. nagariensis]EFJ39016.1 hypothetical protein VOLCADRAFT_108796 [Volvox carteri f. nagariensis]|eukprot:XP_002959919.1 hypothetical protein VOLCADRAFT_108796 [Volvox carteri f. nagariensis]